MGAMKWSEKPQAHKSTKVEGQGPTWATVEGGMAHLLQLFSPKPLVSPASPANSHWVLDGKHTSALVGM